MEISELGIFFRPTLEQYVGNLIEELYLEKTPENWGYYCLFDHDDIEKMKILSYGGVDIFSLIIDKNNDPTQSQVILRRSRYIDQYKNYVGNSIVLKDTVSEFPTYHIDIRTIKDNNEFYHRIAITYKEICDFFTRMILNNIEILDIEVGSH